MSSTEDTSAIDEKKTDSSATPTQEADFPGFFSNFITSVIFTIALGVIVIGSFGLYLAKVAKADILPKDVNFAPFTDKAYTIPDIQIDMNIVKQRTFYGFGVWADPTSVYSQKATFNGKSFADSFNKSWIPMLNKTAVPGSFFSNFYLFYE